MTPKKLKSEIFVAQLVALICSGLLIGIVGAELSNRTENRPTKFAIWSISLALAGASGIGISRVAKFVSNQ
jgi:VIT1/CCC1 family predicted Fe2+/Mn2+ transporter